MALERVPSDIRRDGGVARMSDPAMIKGIQEAVTIPVMAKARIGHFAEAQVLEALELGGRRNLSMHVASTLQLQLRLCTFAKCQPHPSRTPSSGSTCRPRTTASRTASGGSPASC
jgi:hypothetical protein